MKCIEYNSPHYNHHLLLQQSYILGSTEVCNRCRFLSSKRTRLYKWGRFNRQIHLETSGNYRFPSPSALLYGNAYLSRYYLGNVAAKIPSFSGKSKSWIQQRKHIIYGSNIIVSQVNVMPLNYVEAFPASSLILAVAKPADIYVLIQTSALLIFVYLVANFWVPQLLSKSLGFDKVEENEKPINADSMDEEKQRPTSTKKGFNSSKPK